jgi:hypothetical protein
MKDLTRITDKLLPILKSSRRYLIPVVCLIVLVIYGFLVYRVNILNTTEPSESDIAAKSQTVKVPHIDPVVLKQLKSLQDNSVNVQSLFNQARSNPFQE